MQGAEEECHWCSQQVLEVLAVCYYQKCAITKKTDDDVPQYAGGVGTGGGEGGGGGGGGRQG